jgi:hypothetical protein
MSTPKRNVLRVVRPPHLTLELPLGLIPLRVKERFVAPRRGPSAVVPNDSCPVCRKFGTGPLG